MPTAGSRHLAFGAKVEGLSRKNGRHEVENLIRRRSIFYWRPRVPRTFRRCAADARLSFITVEFLESENDPFDLYI